MRLPGHSRQRDQPLPPPLPLPPYAGGAGGRPLPRPAALVPPGGVRAPGGLEAYTA